MKNQSELEILVEKYIGGKLEKLVIDYSIAENVVDMFALKTVKRLFIAYELYKGSRSFYEDFLLAIREYLLVFKTSISLPFRIPKTNDYAISFDDEKQRYFTSLQLPDGVITDFVNQVYSGNAPIETESGYILTTDPFIYHLTEFSAFKTHAQKLSVYGALNTPDGYTTLVSLPTGGGKSLITQTISYQKDGLTIIIVPTVSLAIDQVRVAKQIIKNRDVDAEIFSYSSDVDAAPIIKAVKDQTAKMLFISPEALINNQGFKNAISEANKKRYLKNIVIDEAHIVVDWGASFRVDYQCLESWRKNLIFSNPNLRTFLLSATFEQKSIDILKSFFSQEDKWIEVRCDELRHEPRYMVINNKSYTAKQKKLIELVKKLPHPMIIYVARPVEADELKKLLHENGINNVVTFTGLTSNSKRRTLIDEWVDDRFEIMIATSAFGVGVDKQDVRTVIHTYIPENPNAYYQELGRGGRDRLPCLSVLCLYIEDEKIGRNRISKRVLTTEKLVRRWDSIYNNVNSRRLDNKIYIDTTIKPNYALDPMDDSPTSDTDMNWNVYVLLFLRRYGLIRVDDVITENGKYIFIVQILDDALRSTDDALTNVIDHYRSLEWESFSGAYSRMVIATKKINSECISEMFYDTYQKVSEYCAGCNAHTTAIIGDSRDYPLKMPVREPKKLISSEAMAFVGDGDDMAIMAPNNVDISTMKILAKKGISTVILMNDETSSICNDIICKLDARNMFIIGEEELLGLIKISAYYFISGVVAVIYPNDDGKAFEKYRIVKQYLVGRSGIKVVHIISHNFEFKSIDKTFTELIAGQVTALENII
ncbi:DEAD/DEAH box helicase [Anaerocolumna xylanovorans]|uniref:DNA 3'-5' helicase n=1 Tax=Anaerocolumna xylanovorans DSM 12503 TaxID=1121345 RepID=A0A1M7YL68_9FIRM|nr:DEAD/DEAH box helicase [Anaerocolumna xylanovorans]SHO53371.1 ATP-dependent DNA helicase RecQ [Anaerocolumna xylanovorans DSM 12503]